MADLTTAARDKLPTSDFGMPGARKYPMPDKAHAANAKGRATQQEKKGNLSASEVAKIKAKADKILTQGKVKKKPVDPPPAAPKAAPDAPLGSDQDMDDNMPNVEDADADGM